ncbi:alpha/beta hydrolase [Phyllobacterium salinisoli]|uniref:Alpha/beta hydrolase n=1 Tax=Phyllobacterium salinisoli TaxID=1899321 RepID=A0A368K042_9HYPH|nr:alpha/beta hydrolase [Phyllobacterium salinisoli]RCS22534.1 alpha/beta hydrolase [Phyllobacterium salinisoli]
MTETDLYRIRDFVPDFDAVAAEFAERSRALSARSKIRADIAYGARPRETLDLVFPENAASGAPLHVFVHGGYWRSGEKTNYHFVAEPVLAAGGIAALIEYDLMPTQRLPVLVDQVRHAVLWLQHHAAEFGAEPRRLTVSGHSAGAHLSSYLAATGPREVRARPALPDVKGLFLLSGIYDLSEIPNSFLRDEAKMSHVEAAAWSPLTSTQHNGPRRVIAFGEDETAPFHDQARALQAKLSMASQRAELLPVPELNHMTVVLDFADVQSTLGRRLADMVGSH